VHLAVAPQECFQIVHRDVIAHEVGTLIAASCLQIFEQRHGAVAAATSSARERAQRAKAFRVERFEQHVVDSLLVGREALEQRVRPCIGPQQDFSPVDRVGDLVEDALSRQLVDLEGDERAGTVQPRGHFADRQPFGARTPASGSRTARRRRRRPRRSRRGRHRAVAVGDEIVDQAAEFGVGAFDQQRLARDGAGPLAWTGHRRILSRRNTFVN
jgi:hypothetical protein